MPDEKITVIQRVAEDGSNALGYLWFVLLAIWGGTANYIHRAQHDETREFKIVELVGEWFISGLSGLLTAYLCAEAGFSYYITAVACAVAGHMGGRAINMIEFLFKSKIPMTQDAPQRRNKDDKNE